VAAYSARDAYNASGPGQGGYRFVKGPTAQEMYRNPRQKRSGIMVASGNVTIDLSGIDEKMAMMNPEKTAQLIGQRIAPEAQKALNSRRA